MSAEIVNDIHLLRRMEKAGHVKFHPQTGQKITGLYSPQKFTCYYVDEVDFRFEFEGAKYGQLFIDGCFCPFVAKLDAHRENINS